MKCRDFSISRTLFAQKFNTLMPNVVVPILYFDFIQFELHISSTQLNSAVYYVAEIWYDLTRSNDNDTKERKNGCVKLAKTMHRVTM